MKDEERKNQGEQQAAPDQATRRSKRKIIGMVALTLGNLAMAGAATFAWFTIATQKTKIQTVSGDLNVEIQKVTAYKYVYPYYANSAEFINYDGTGEVEAFVIEDSNYPAASFEDSVTITLGDAVAGSYVASGTGTSSAIVFPSDSNFNYYLIGDAVFSGTTTAWSAAKSIPFSHSAAPSAENPVLIDNVVVSAGAEFILFDARNAGNLSCSYLNYASMAEPSSGKGNRFEITENNTLRCKAAGIYSFSYTPTTLTITLHNRNNDAIIGSNILDPTKINVDYWATASRPASINDYIPDAVHAQNTMVVLDVLLKYKNASEIDAGLKVVRTASTAFDYTSTTANLVGYVSENEQNAISASAFYAFYPVMSQASLGTASEVWTALHNVKTNATGAYSKFSGEGSSIEAAIHSDTLTIEEGKAQIDASLNQTYHCYIGMDYDYEHTRYFLNENRLGKTYRLDRDFGFYFTATQHLEGSQE